MTIKKIDPQTLLKQFERGDTFDVLRRRYSAGVDRIKANLLTALAERSERKTDAAKAKDAARSYVALIKGRAERRAAKLARRAKRGRK